jgi:CopG family nickel-responsive transcriptional regulator
LVILLTDTTVLSNTVRDNELVLNNEGVTRISMSLPPELLEAFDKASEHSGYRDRSKALQAAMRSFISDFETGLRGGHVVGSIVMVYNHETHGADEGITETSHHHRQSILSSLHAHIDAAHCLCALLVRGKVQDITRLEGELKRQKGIMQVKSSYLKTESV